MTTYDRMPSRRCLDVCTINLVEPYCENDMFDGEIESIVLECLPIRYRCFV